MVVRVLLLFARRVRRLVESFFLCSSRRARLWRDCKIHLYIKLCAPDACVRDAPTTTCDARIQCLLLLLLLLRAAHARAPQWHNIYTLSCYTTTTYSLLCSAG